MLQVSWFGGPKGTDGAGGWFLMMRVPTAKARKCIRVQYLRKSHSDFTCVISTGSEVPGISVTHKTTLPSRGLWFSEPPPPQPNITRVERGFRLLGLGLSSLAGMWSFRAQHALLESLASSPGVCWKVSLSLSLSAKA